MEKEAIKALGRNNKGFRYERINHVNPFDETDTNKEKVFINRWQKENKKRPGNNYGRGILQDLFTDRKGVMAVPIFLLKIKPIHRFIAATVIQWLGTNCGFSFLIECLKDCGYTLERTQKQCKTN